MAVIELDRLSKRFGPVTALDGVTLQIEKAKVGLLGPNGAGKSTLLKCLLGLIQPSGGTSRVLGMDIASHPLEVRQRVGYLPEVDCHIPGQTAVEYVAYSGELSGMPPKDAIKRAHEILDYIGLGEERYRVVDTYSTGMRQKVKLAQAIVHDPDLLFLDEPTNGLDPEGRETMLALVKELGEVHGIGLLYSSHLLGEVEAVCDEVVILQAGKVIAQDELTRLMKDRGEGAEVRMKGEEDDFLHRVSGSGLSVDEKSPGCFIVSGTAAEGKPLWRVVFEEARASRVQLRSFRPIRSTLEDAFLDALEGEPAEGEERKRDGTGIGDRG
ncbi:MAG: ABC transporter ATP-binding protein [Planctomycetota bacterium]|jgi:ABC-2 type transport system ATP-binding protein